MKNIDQRNKRSVNSKDDMKGSYLGTEFNQDEIEKELKFLGANFETFKYDELINKTAEFISNEKAVGWFQGRMEFGPRALGARSILADPRSSSMQKNLNLKVKYRESFRPFAPSVLRDDLSEWFNIDNDSPYMLLVSNINSSKCLSMTEKQKNLFGVDKLNVKRSEIPAVTHVDYSARIQTINKDRNGKYFELIKKFKEITGCPILVNTSFNIRGEPIVCSVQDAFRCFMGTNLDILVIEDFILFKSDQIQTLNDDYKKDFKLD